MFGNNTSFHTKQFSNFRLHQPHILVFQKNLHLHLPIRIGIQQKLRKSIFRYCFFGSFFHRFYRNLLCRAIFKFYTGIFLWQRLFSLYILNRISFFIVGEIHDQIITQIFILGKLDPFSASPSREASDRTWQNHGRQSISTRCSHSEKGEGIGRSEGSTGERSLRHGASAANFSVVSSGELTTSAIMSSGSPQPQSASSAMRIISFSYAVVFGSTSCNNERIFFSLHPSAPFGYPVFEIRCATASITSANDRGSYRISSSISISPIQSRIWCAASCSAMSAPIFSPSITIYRCVSKSASRYAAGFTNSTSSSSS